LNGKGTRSLVCHSEECTSEHVRKGDDRHLRSQSDVHGRLEQGVQRYTRDQPLDRLLRDEGEERNERERPGGRTSLKPPAESQGERRGHECEADPEELRCVGEVAVDLGVLPAHAEDCVSGCVSRQAAGSAEGKRETERRPLHGVKRTGRVEGGAVRSARMVRLACVVSTLAFVLAFAGPAWADGDPASDYLLVRDVFFPLSIPVRPQLARQLMSVTRDARKAGKPIKVALIASPNDLGAVPSLYGKPTDYARFLGAEIQFVYRGKLLIVMPEGAGLSEAGRLLAERAVVDAKVEPGVDGLARTAIDLVGQLALGRAPARPTTASTSGGGGVSVTAIVAPVVAVLALVVAGLALVRRRRRAE
jgi:MYXO-CTERM domain-containing protein